jgi:hypothetical protein
MSLGHTWLIDFIESCYCHAGKLLQENMIVRAIDWT